jgi:hypothetical protein
MEQVSEFRCAVRLVRLAAVDDFVLGTTRTVDELGDIGVVDLENVVVGMIWRRSEEFTFG